MQWKSPNLVWAEILPVIFLAGWVLAEASRTRRVRRFGEPSLMGLPASGLRKAVAVFLSVAGIAAIAAILPLPVRVNETEVRRTELVEIVLDAGLFKRRLREPGFSLDEVNQVVRWIISVPGPTHYSLSRSDDPEIPLIPPTADGDGFVMVLERRLAESGVAYKRASTPARSAGPDSGRSGGSRRRIIITADSSLTEADLSSPEESDRDSMVLRLYSAATASDVAQADPGQAWIWSYRFDLLQRFLAATPRPKTEAEPTGSEEDYIWLFAAIGFVALLGESIWIRSRGGR